MVKCEKCGHLQPGDSIDICRKNNCGYISYPVKTVKANKPPMKVEDKETKE